MPTRENIMFENENFKILICPDRVSRIDNVDDFSKVFHEEIEIKYFTEGSSTLHIGNESVVTEPEDVVVINPYEFHSTVNYAEEKGKYHLLMIGLDFFSGDNRDLINLRYIFMNERSRIKTLIRGNSRISSIISSIVGEFEKKGELYEIAVRGLVLELFALLLRDFKDTSPAFLPSDKHLRYYEVIYPALKMIRGDCGENYTIDELATACGVSKCHFCRIFKESTSMSVVEYRNEHRLQIARVLIKTTNKSISDISLQCGFDDIAYFSRCYKNKFGNSPIKDRAILSK